MWRTLSWLKLAYERDVARASTAADGARAELAVFERSTASPHTKRRHWICKWIEQHSAVNKWYESECWSSAQCAAPDSCRRRRRARTARRGTRGARCRRGSGSARAPEAASRWATSAPERSLRRAERKMIALFRCSEEIEKFCLIQVKYKFYVPPEIFLQRLQGGGISPPLDWVSPRTNRYCPLIKPPNPISFVNNSISNNISFRFTPDQAFNRPIPANWGRWVPEGVNGGRKWIG